ncbi:MAG: ATP-dependent Clp protease adaptor ClpS [Rubricoccaceae bacterium]|nr:ATP-dependent Clp protease adaptor ClpS [Rubricoccaceae bacterium]
MSTYEPDLATADPVVAEPEVLTEATEETDVESPWRVILFDDDIHTFEDVILQLMKATGCTEQQAEKHAWTVHTRGKDQVYEGDFFECFRVQGVLREIQLVTEIEG